MDSTTTKIEVDHALMAKLFGTMYKPEEREYSQEIVLREDEMFGYVVVWSKAEHVCDALAFCITADGGGDRGDDDGWAVKRKGAFSSGDTTDELEDAVVDVDMSVKWDGCMDIRTPGYVHHCGLESLQKLMAVQCYIYMAAREHLLKGPEDAHRADYLPPWES